MECNKDEAVRAKEMADQKFAAKDYMGAKKFALKAQNLFPGLSGIPPMMGVLEVYISAEKKVNGEADWYGVLGVDPKADEETIRKKYRKLALILHPDKNSSPGAEGAFKLISEAWGLLSDKAKRAAYDQKTGNVRLHRNISSTAAPGFPNFTQSTNFSAANAQTTTTQAAGSSIPASSYNPNTFWTMCPNCSMKYEYLLIHRRNHLQCRDCKTTFWPIQIFPHVQFTKSNLSEQWQNPNLEKAGNRSTLNTGRSSAPSAFKRSFYNLFPTTAGGCAAAHAPIVDQMAQTATKTHVSGASTTGCANNAAKRRCTDGVGVSRYGMHAKNLHATHKIVKEKIRKEMNEQGSSSVAKPAVEKGETGNERGKSSGFSEVQCGRDMFCSDKPNDTKDTGTCDLKQSGPSGVSSDSEAETLDVMSSINVPDTDFHNFENTEMSFEQNQVWAAFDEDDGMPRYYAKIHSIISSSPFTMKISWLNSKTNKELGPLNWVSSGFSKTCGEFRVGKHEISKNALNSFSHKVSWKKGARGIVCIYPMKGHVWALYRNWSPDWNELTEDEVKHKYDMVEVVEDYNKELGVTVTPLVKVSGFKTVFARCLDPIAVMRRIPREEMFRLSHQVPAQLLTGQEAPNAPKGCWELDPAAMPADHFQVIADLKDEENVKIVEN